MTRPTTEQIGTLRVIARTVDALDTDRPAIHNPDLIARRNIMTEHAYLLGTNEHLIALAHQGTEQLTPAIEPPTERHNSDN